MSHAIRSPLKVWMGHTPTIFLDPQCSKHWPKSPPRWNDRRSVCHLEIQVHFLWKRTIDRQTRRGPKYPSMEYVGPASSIRTGSRGFGWTLSIFLSIQLLVFLSTGSVPLGGLIDYLPYLPAYLPTYLPTYLRPYLLTYLSTYLPTYLPAYLPPCLSIHVNSYL